MIASEKKIRGAGGQSIAIKLAKNNSYYQKYFLLGQVTAILTIRKNQIRLYYDFLICDIV